MAFQQFNWWFGFFIVLQCQVNSKPATSKCGGYFNSPRGNIHTPKYPHTYDYELNCQWMIEAATGNVVQLTFKDFDVESFDNECDTDKVHIRDGTNSSSPLLGKVLCGQTTPEVITSTGRYMTIYFTSDYTSSGGRGFNADYVVLSASEGENCVTNACGGTIETTSCQIQSPGFPISFESSLNCSWIIKAPHPSQRISFRFIELDLDADNSLCLHNNVTIYDGNSVQAPIIHESLCDFRRNGLQHRLLKSTGPTVVLRFRTSSSVERRAEINGFNAKFEVLDGQGKVVLPTKSRIVTSSPVKTFTSTTTSTPTTITETAATSTSLSTMEPATKQRKEESDQLQTTIPTTKEKTTKSVGVNPISSPAAMSGLVIGIIVVLVIIALAVLLKVAFNHWKKRNAILSRNLRDDDVRSDVNTLLSSNDSREFSDIKKNGGSIVRRTEEVL